MTIVEEPPALTASGIIIDSLGRRWNPALHPRDRHGRFIETFAEIRAFLKQGSSRADFTGRVIAIDRDNTAIVQVRGGRGKYAELRDQLVRVPINKTEAYEPKARIGQPAPRPVTKGQRAQINQFVRRVRGAGARAKDFPRGDDPTDQLIALEDLADKAEKADLPDVRDRALDFKGYIRSEPSKSDILDAAKAILPDAREGDDGDAVRRQPERGEGEPAQRSEGADRRGAFRQRARDAAVDGGLWGQREGGTAPEGVRPDLIKRAYSFNDEYAAEYREAFGREPRDFYELDAAGADDFLKAITTAKENDAHGAFVTAYGRDTYADGDNVRLFLADGGKAGFALRNGEIISVFSDPSERGMTDFIMPLSLQEGGRYLDAYVEDGGGLGVIYGKWGFTPVAQTPFVAEFAPEDWWTEEDGEPPIYFMGFDPDNPASGFDADAAPVIDDYDEGVRLAKEFGGIPDDNERKAVLPGPGEDQGVGERPEAEADAPEPEPEPEPGASDSGAGRGRDGGGVREEGPGGASRGRVALPFDEDVDPAVARLEDVITEAESVQLRRPFVKNPGEVLPEDNRDNAVRQARRAIDQIRARQETLARLQRELNRATGKDRARLQTNISREEMRLRGDLNTLFARERAIRASIRAGQPQSVSQLMGIMGRALRADIKSAGESLDARYPEHVSPYRDPEYVRRELKKNLKKRQLEFKKNLKKKLSPKGRNVVVVDDALTTAFSIEEPAKLEFRRPVADSPAAQLARAVSDALRANENGDVNYPRDDFKRQALLDRDIRVGDYEQALKQFDEEVAGRGYYSPEFEDLIRGKLTEFAADPAAAKKSVDARELRPDEVEGWEDVDPQEWADSWNSQRVAELARGLPLQGGDAALLTDMLGVDGELPKRVLRREGVAFVLDDDVPPEALQEASRVYDMLQGKFPLDGEKIIRFTSLRENLADLNTWGDAIPGGNIMRIDPYAIESGPSPDDGHFKDHFYGGSVTDLEHTIVHEWGHMYGPADSDARVEQSWAVVQQVAEDQGMSPRDVPEKLMRAYEQKDLVDNSAEFWAENFAEWVLTDGKTQDPVTQAFAKEVGLDSPQPQAVGRLERAFAQVADPADRDKGTYARYAEITDVPQADAALRDMARRLGANLEPDAVRNALEANGKPAGGEESFKNRLRMLQYDTALKFLGLRDADDAREVSAAVRNLFAVLDPEFAAERRRQDAGQALVDVFVPDDGRPDDHIPYDDISAAFDYLASPESQQLAWAFFRSQGAPVDMADAAFPEGAGMSNERGGFLVDGMRMVEAFRNADILDAYGFAPGEDVDRNNLGLRDHYRKILDGGIARFGGDRERLADAIAAFNNVYGDGAADEDRKSPSLPAPDKDKAGTEPPGGLADPPEPPDPPAIAPGVPDTIRRLADVFFRGRTKAARRGVGNIHLADRFAFDEKNQELRKGDVVWFPERDARGRKGQWQRPEADGYVQNIIVETEEVTDSDGNEAPSPGDGPARS